MKNGIHCIDKAEISLKESWFEISGWYIPKNEDEVEFVFLKKHLLFFGLCYKI